MACMFGPKIKNVFKSRWQAVFWSLSVLLTAYCSIPAPGQKSDGEQVAAMVKAAKSKQASADHHVNPWAK